MSSKAHQTATDGSGTTITTPDVPDRPFNVVRALTLRQKGLTYEQIAELMDQPKSTVYFKLNQVSQVLDSPQVLQDYRDQRTNLFEIAEERMLRSVLDDECIQKASLNNRAYAFKQIFDARRLESGQSTGNLGILGKLVVESAKDLFVRPVDKKTASELPENQNQSVSNAIETHAISDSTDVHS